MLTNKFDSIRMEEHKTFTEYYTWLQDILNTHVDWGEKILEHKVIRKILITLPKRFRPKVAAIKEVKYPDTMKVKKLVGSLQTYEMSYPTTVFSPSLLKVKVWRSNWSRQKTWILQKQVRISLVELEKQLALLTKKFCRNFKKKKNRAIKSSSSSKQKILLERRFTFKLLRKMWSLQKKRRILIHKSNITNARAFGILPRIVQIRNLEKDASNCPNKKTSKRRLCKPSLGITFLLKGQPQVMRMLSLRHF